MLVFLVLCVLGVLYAKSQSERIASLTRRVDLLEAALRRPARAPAPEPEVPAPEPRTAPPPPTEPADPAPRAPAPEFVDTLPGFAQDPASGTSPGEPASEPSWGMDGLVAVIRRNTFAAAGLGLLLLGFAFLFRSLEWGHLLPPGGKVALGWLAAAGLSVLGLRLRNRNPLWGQIAQGGGAAIAYLSTYVGASRFGLFPEPLALALFVFLSALVVWRAWQEDAQALAAVGFLGGFAAPVLAFGVHTPSPAFHLGFALVLSAAALWITYRKRWAETAGHVHACAAALSALAVFESPVRLSPSEQQGFSWAFLAVFLTWAVAVARLPAPPARLVRTVQACLPVTVLTFLAVESYLLHSTSAAIVALGLSAALAAIALVLLARSVLRSTFLTVAAGALAWAPAAARMDVRHVGLAWLIQGSGLLLTLSRETRVRRMMAWALVVIGLVSLVSPVPVAGTTPSLGGLATLQGLGVLAVTAAAEALRRRSVAPGLKGEAEVLLVVGGILLLVLGSNLGALAYNALPSSCVTENTIGCGTRASYAVSASALASAIWAGVIAALHARHPWRPALLGACGLSGLLWGMAAIVRAHHGASWSDPAVLFRLAALAAPLTVSALILRVHGTRLRTEHVPLQLATLLNLCLFSAIVLHQGSASGFWTILVAGLGLSVFAGFVQRRLRTPPHRDIPLAQWAMNATSVAGVCLAFTASLGLSPLPSLGATLLGAMADRALATLLGSLGTLWVWWRVGTLPESTHERRTIAAAGAACVVALVGSFVDREGQGIAWLHALQLPITPLLIAVTSVGSLWAHSRAQERRGWFIAAGISAFAAIHLLFTLRSALTSPISMAAALIVMGVLFMGAGYVAPVPSKPPGNLH